MSWVGLPVVELVLTPFKNFNALATPHEEITWDKLTPPLLLQALLERAAEPAAARPRVARQGG